jgi:16S rRNA (uracil1498-N3)-methyltransferase
MIDDNTPMHKAPNPPRFYCHPAPVDLVAGATLALPESAARHAVRVLRLSVGDPITLFDGRGGEYGARIAGIERAQVSVDVLEQHARERESPLPVTLVQALQAGDKMDLTVQKAVELGVWRIVPVVSRRSVVRLDGERAARRVEHWRGVVASACEQCGRNRLPDVDAIEGLERWLGRAAAVGGGGGGGAGVRRLMLAPHARETLASLPRPVAGERVELLIGAEGGLAPEEMRAAALAGFVGIRLGPRILRTETAGLAALAALQCLWGDLMEAADHV